MKLLDWPSVAKLQAWSPAVKAHTRGAAGAGGHYNFTRAPGASWVASLTLAPMCTADALQFRAFLHRLRGRSGSFWFAPPLDKGPAPVPQSCPLAGSLTIHGDCTPYSDGTMYADTYTGVTPPVADTLASAVAKGSATVTISGAAAAYLLPGGLMRIGTHPSQLVRVVAVSGALAAIEPRARRAYLAGEPIEAGKVAGLFRLASQTPAVSLVAGRSHAVTLEIEEAY